MQKSHADTAIPRLRRRGFAEAHRDARLVVFVYRRAIRDGASVAEARRDAFEIYLWRNPDVNRAEAAATVEGMVIAAAMVPNRSTVRGNSA